MQKRKSKNSGMELKSGSGSKKGSFDKKTSFKSLLQDHPDIYKKCIVSVDEKGLIYAKVVNPGSGELTKIGLFGLRNRGHSFPDDEVVVEVLKKQSEESEDEFGVAGGGENMPPGKVVGVVKSANDLANWVIECMVDESNTDILRPIDRSLPSLNNLERQRKPGHVAVFEFRDQKNIIFKRHIPVISNAPMPDIFLVRYLSWKGRDLPAGVVVGLLPAEELLRRSMRILRLESRNQVEFSESALLEVENNFPECFTLSEIELSRRLDCTSMMTFTVDPPDSRDIDDALSITEMENGQHVIGVHIADVSYFVKFETELDRVSRKRGTSIYEIGGRDPIAMLPKRLSTELCSLQEGQKRLTLSVFMTTDADYGIINVELKKTVICSQFRLDYFQVEAALRGTPVANAELPDKLSRVLFLLNRISKRWRKNRIGHAEFSRQTNNLEYANTPMAHQLVEEMMVTANHHVAKHLLEHFPMCTPLVVHQVPDEPEIQDWRRRFPSEAAIIEMVQPFRLDGRDLSAARVDATGLKKKFVLHKPVWEEMKRCLEKGELEKLQSFILSPEYHPCLIVAWFNLPSFTKKALHVCSGDRKPDGHRHFSLNLPHYTQFTSPIRRYLDVVVHRLFHLSVEGEVEQSRYSQSLMSTLCEENQAIKTRVGNYESSVKNTHSSELLRQKPLVIHTLVERAIATGFRLNCLKLSAYLKLWPVDVAFLGARKVKAVQQHRRGKVILSYSLRMYDLQSTSVVSSASSQEQRSPVKLSGRRHVVYTTVALWQELVTLAMEGDLGRMASCMEAVGASLVDPAKTITPGFQRDVSGEGSTSQCPIDFSLAITAGDVIQIQVAGEVSGKGKLVPFVQLLSLSPTVDVCLEHRSNTGKCFAQLTGIKNASQVEHEDIESYSKAWMSLIVAESAENSVARNDSFILRNVSITWLGRDEAFFQVPAEFCRERCIPVFHEIVMESEGDDVRGGCVGFMCLRYPGVRKKAPETELPIGNVMDLSDPFTWVGHCVVTGIRRIVDVYRIHFRLNQSSTEIPEQLLNELNSSEATVEWISNTQAERNTIRALCRMRRTDCFAAVVATVPSRLPLPGPNYVALAGKHISKIKRGFSEEQVLQIGEALCRPFSMIHGHTSSGKTYMAAQLAYRFSLMNKKLAGTDHQRMQVLCCGPTEGSLQSLAHCLCDESLGINVVLICSEEEEQKEFPLPGRSKNLKCQSQSCDDQMAKIKTLYLHHRVRGSSTPNGDFIRLVDQKIALNQDDVTDDLSRYLSAIEEEESEVLRNADILLCSCATSLQKRMRCNVNIQQVIIDDSQACTEPETLLPLVHQSVYQLVLFGDIKQLKPFVVSPTARKYGLTRSLFERYVDLDEEKVNLSKQYTMHESLQHFLSTCIYDSPMPKIRKARADSMSSRCSFWPEGSNRPLLFLNVVGVESQSRSGGCGFTSDISNPEEARVVAEVCKQLAAKCASKMDIAALSPYEAQCVEIRKHLKDFPRVSVSAINSAQGKHWSYVVLSTVRSQPVSEKPDKKRLHLTLGILCAKNACNTLLSRAYDGLIITGNRTLLECDDNWEKLIRYFEKYGSVMESGEFLSSLIK